MRAKLLFFVFFCMGFSVTAGTAATFKQFRIPSPEYVGEYIVVDLNGDKYPDIVTKGSWRSTNIRVFLNDRNQKFSRQLTRGFAQLGSFIIGAADFNGDGKLDLAVDNSYATIHFSIFPGKGTGEFSSPKAVNTSTGPEPELFRAVILDFDGDGRPDIVGGCNDKNLDNDPKSLFAFRNLGHYKFSAVKIKEDVIFHGIVGGDFDGDGLDDIVASRSETGTLTFFKSNGDGTFSEGAVTIVGDVGDHLKAADLNGDGKLDLVGDTSKIVGFEGWSMLGQGAGKFTKKKILKGDFHSGFELVDLAGDKSIDLVADYMEGYWIYQGQGNGSFKPLMKIGEGWDFKVADLNKDGKLDLVTGRNWGVEGIAAKDSEMYALVFFLNNRKPVSLSISNLTISSISLTTGWPSMINMTAKPKLSGTRPKSASRRRAEAFILKTALAADERR